MEHLSYIKTSQTWTCPKSGVYKIIAVGGGSGGAYALSTANASGINGGTTSFGSYVSAAGGQAIVTADLPLGKGWYGGKGGYNLTQYGGGGECVGTSGYRPPAGNGGLMGGQGIGYGASGGFYAKETYSNYKAYIGNAGDIALAISEFTSGVKVSVTVGGGGSVPAAADNVSFNLAGRSGVVIVEYLGTFDLS